MKAVTISSPPRISAGRDIKIEPPTIDDGVQVWQDLSDQCQSTALAALGVERYTALRRQGRALPPADVVTLAASS